MQELLNKIKLKSKYVLKYFPVIFARHMRLIFLGGAIIALALGSLLFYRNAYLVAKVTDIEVFVSVKKVNTELFGEILQYVEDQNKLTPVISNANPFIE